MKVKIGFDNYPSNNRFLMSINPNEEGVEVEVQEGFYWLYKHVESEMAFIQDKLEELFNIALKQNSDKQSQ